MIRVVAERAAVHGLLVIVAATRLAPGDIVGGLRERNPPGHWYSKWVGSTYSGWEMPEATVLQNWKKVAAALCGQWNIVGVDLMSDVNEATWGAQELSDWDLAAMRLGNQVLEQCPRWMVLVHGIGPSPTLPDAIAGANLAAATQSPVLLSNPEKVAYVAQLRGPSAGQHSYFGEHFPGSLADVFAKQWGAVQTRTGALRNPHLRTVYSPRRALCCVLQARLSSSL